MEHRARVLVVDDEPDILTLYEVNLELAGYDVVTARDGADALARLATGPPFDVLILDIMMPRVDGWGVLGRIAEDDSVHRVPVIMVSARASETDRARAAVMGAAFLPKPFTTVALLELVEEAAGVPAAPVC